MKQAMIVLTLWIFSQNAHSQSVNLEGYSQGDARLVSNRHSNALINRQIMADIDPHSLPAKTETPGSLHPKSGATEKSLEDAKAMWANAKALQDNTRALEENTKALKENTEMMRALLLSGKYHHVGSYAGQQTSEQRYESALAMSGKPGSQFPLFSGAPAKIAAPETISKPEVYLASASPMPMSAADKTMVAPIELAKKMPANDNVTKPNALSAVPAKIEKTPTRAVNVLLNTTEKSMDVPAVTTKIAAKPHICYLNGASDAPEMDVTLASVTLAPAEQKPFAVNTSVKTHAPKAQPAAVAKMPIAKAAAKTSIQNQIPAATPIKNITNPKALAANVATKPRVAKAIATTPATPKPLTNTIVKADVYQNLATKAITANSAKKPGTPIASNTVKPQAPKITAPVAAAKIPLASAMTRAPKLTNLPVNPTPAKVAAIAQSPKAITPKASTTMPLASVLPGTIKHANLPANPIPAKNVNNLKTSAAIASVKPQALGASPAAFPAKLAGLHTKTSQATMAPIVIVGAKPVTAAANHTNGKKTHGSRITNAARSSMSVAIETGMLARKNKKVSLGYLMQFPLLERSYDNGVRTAGHIPTDVYSGFKEGDVITTHGYISLIAIEDSGTKSETYYLQLVVNPYKKDSCLNIRITADRFAGDARKKLTDNARQFVREQLLSGNTPSRSGNVMQNPVFVSITGQLVYNSALAGAMRGPHPLYIGKKGVRSYTPWEISNVNRIQFTR